MNRKQVARQLVTVARELVGAKKDFSDVKVGTSFKWKGKTYWKASRTRACLQKNMVRIRQDEPVEV